MNKILIAPNVSRVPIYSPFRYPGGKSRLYPFVAHWIENLRMPVSLLVEPFAGAAHIGLASVIEGKISRVILVEKDEDVASVWSTIFSDDCEWLIDKIINFELSDTNVKTTLNQTPMSVRERAFKVLLRNRISRNGISALGAGILGGGENGKGFHSRWYPDTLSRRLVTISQVREDVQFIEGDG